MSELGDSALIEEYKSLRSEIGQRLSYQIFVLGGIITLTSALLPLTIKFAPEDSVTALAAAPLVFAVMSWLYFEQDIFITQAATYLHQDLAPAIRAASGEDAKPILRWETKRHELLFAAPRLLDVMFAFRLLATLGPGVAALVVVAMRILSPEGIHAAHLHFYDYILIALDLMAVCFLAWISRHVIDLYRRITDEP